MGPFIQYTYARIQSIIRKAILIFQIIRNDSLHPKEKEHKQLELFPEVIQMQLRIIVLPYWQISMI
jgi:arginyl-tRNA synthetase